MTNDRGMVHLALGEASEERRPSVMCSFDKRLP